MTHLSSVRSFIACVLFLDFSGAGASQRCNSPEVFTQGKKGEELKCPFPAHIVSWFKDNRSIINGTDDLYQIEERLYNGNVLSKLFFSLVRMQHAGFYTCKANTSHNNTRSCKVEVIVKCEEGYIQATPITVTASETSNVSLYCSVLSRADCLFLDSFKLTWEFENETLENNAIKYTIREHHVNNKCKKRRRLLFSLEIINVTYKDDGKYSCQMSCDSVKKSSLVWLHTVAQPTKVPDVSQKHETTRPITLFKDHATYSTSAVVKDWIVACVAVSVFAVILVLFCTLKKRRRARKERYNCSHQEEIVSDKLFISYSSKDFAWVTNNLITILEKHSISYTIHFRDFELGKPFIQNMADSVYGSRQVLIVLSDNYLASNFCREELHMAVEKRVYTGDSSLIIVLMNKLEKKRLPFPLRNKNVLQFNEQMKQECWERELIKRLKPVPWKVDTYSKLNDQSAGVDVAASKNDPYEAVTTNSIRELARPLLQLSYTPNSKLKRNLRDDC